jgi:hypothetical protein
MNSEILMVDFKTFVEFKEILSELSKDKDNVIDFSSIPCEKIGVHGGDIWQRIKRYCTTVPERINSSFVLYRTEA